MPQSAPAPREGGSSNLGGSWAACFTRVVADSNNRVEWLRARASGITATDVAKLTSDRSVAAVVRDKQFGSSFSGNRYTDHGREREPEIASFLQRVYGIEPSTQLFHAEHERRHLATPDGVRVSQDGVIELAEIKTTAKEWRTIPRNYLRQIWWQQYVLGAERTLFAWEVHDNFVVRDAEPRVKWVDRDDAEILGLIKLSQQVLEQLDAAAQTPRADSQERGGSARNAPEFDETPADFYTPMTLREPSGGRSSRLADSLLDPYPDHPW